MSSIRGECSGCGSPLEIEVAGLFAGASLAGGLCPRCTERQLSEQGGVVFDLERDLPGARFVLGKVTITAGAIAALADSNQHAIAFLRRHVHGDWGACGHVDRIVLTEDERRRGWEATDDSGKINASNLGRGTDRIMSEYATGSGRRLWVITALEGCGGTTVLLPEEY
jgi:hypothetical protein